MARRRNGDADGASAPAPQDFSKLMPTGGIRVKGVDNRPFPVCGLALRTLAERVMYGTNVMPFSRVVEFYGPPRSCKSALVFDRYRCVVEAGGYYMHNDVEDKDAAALRASILNYPAHINDADWTRGNFETLQQWQMSIYKYVEWFKTTCLKGSAPWGRSVPFAVGVDSLMAKLSVGTSETIAKNGGATGRSFAEEALVLSPWFKEVVKYISRWPFYLFVVNHDKPKQGHQPGMVLHHTPGGVAQGFAATTRFLCRSVKDLERRADGVEGQRIEIKTDKNSSSVTNGKVEVDFLWRYDTHEETGEFRQITWFDWDAATVKVLWGAIEKGSGERIKQLKELLGLRKSDGGRYSCAGAGLEDPVSPSEVGLAINADADLSRALDRIFEIRQHAVLARGTDLWTALNWTATDEQKKADRDAAASEEGDD